MTERSEDSPQADSQKQPAQPEPLLPEVEWRDDITEAPLPPHTEPLAEQPITSQPARIEIHQHDDSQQPAAEPEAGQHKAPEEEPFAYRDNLSKSVSQMEARVTEINDLLKEAKSQAKDLIDANDFDKAASQLEKAKTLRRQLKKQSRNLHNSQTQLKRVEELVNHANILDLKAEFDRRLSKEKDRRNRIQDKDPLDSFTDMLKESLLNKYLQTGADPERPRQYPSSVVSEIERLMAKSYQELEDSLSKSAVESKPQAPHEDAPLVDETEPSESKNLTSDDIDAVTNVPETERKFTEDDVFVMPGEKSPSLRIKGWGRRSGSGEIVVNLVSDDGRTNAWVNQDEIGNMFELSNGGGEGESHTLIGSESEEPGHSAIAESPELAAEVPAATATGPAESPLAGPESGSSGGADETEENRRWWERLFGSEKELEEIERRWGSRAIAVRNLGSRALRFLKRPSENADESDETKKA